MVHKTYLNCTQRTQLSEDQAIRPYNDVALKYVNLSKSTVLLIMRKSMDKFWGKLMKWHDGIGRSALDVPTHHNLQRWHIQSRKHGHEFKKL